MKCYNYLIAIFLTISICGNTFSQYYYSAGEQQPLSVDTTKIMVLFNDGYSYNWDDFSSDYPEIDSMLYQGQGYEGYKFFAVTTGDYNNLIDSIQIDMRVSRVNPYFLLNPEKPLLVGRTICCKFNDNVGIDFIDSLNEFYHVGIVYEREYTSNQFLLEVRKDATMSTLDIANLYYNLDETEFCHPNFFGSYEYHNYDIIDYYWEEQWATNRIFESSSGSPRHKAFEITTGDSDIIIASIDQGIAPHEDLPAERLTMGYDFERMDNDPTPCGIPCCGWHGMAAAGLIGASHNRDSTLLDDNVTGIYGVAPNCRIMPLKIGSGIFTPVPPDTINWPHCWGWMASPERVASAIAYAWALGADIISGSWGDSLRLDVVEAEIRQASTAGRDGKGCGIFFSSGNWSYGIPIYPAAMPEVISVGSLHPDDSVWTYSGYYKVDVVAPSGTSSDHPILTLDLMGSLGYNYQGHDCLDPGDLDYNCRFGGTSAAQPERPELRRWFYRDAPI